MQGGEIMTDKLFPICWSESANYSDPDSYISDLALSTMWGDPEDAEVPPERIDQLRSIWTVYHMPMREIRAASSLSQAKFAERFCIPRRTVENWDAGVNTPPDYVRIMIARSLGLL